VAPDLLEYELRRLPEVVAAAVDDQRVTVLIGPSADADGVRVVVAAILAAAGVELDVTVLGGTTSAVARARTRVPVMAGTAAGIGLFATVAVAAALTGVLPVVPGTDDAPVARSEPTAAAPARRTPAMPGARRILAGDQPTWAAIEEPPTLPFSADEAADAAPSLVAVADRRPPAPLAHVVATSPAVLVIASPVPPAPGVVDATPVTPTIVPAPSVPAFKAPVPASESPAVAPAPQPPRTTSPSDGGANWYSHDSDHHETSGDDDDHDHDGCDHGEGARVGHERAQGRGHEIGRGDGHDGDEGR
jgi:hypothetical protein